MTDRPWRPGNGQTIDKLYAWIATEPDGGEGVVGGTFPGLGTIPLMGADRPRVESYRKLAEATARATGWPIKLKLFQNSVVIDEIA